MMNQIQSGNEEGAEWLARWFVQKSFKDSVIPSSFVLRVLSFVLLLAGFCFGSLADVAHAQSITRAEALQIAETGPL